MKNAFRVFLAVVLAVSLAVAPVANACCDGFWSCAAAIATGGLSCAVEDLINSIRSMIHNIETIVNSINRNVGEVTGAALNAIKTAGDDLRRLVQTAENDAADALRRAQAIVAEAEKPAFKVLAKPDLSAGASQINSGAAIPPAAAAGGAAKGAGASSAMLPIALPAPCEPAAALDALRRAMTEVEKQRKLAAQQAASVAQAASKAQDQVRSKFDFAGRMAQDTLLGPLSDLGSMLSDLIHHPERLFNPAALVNDMLTRVTNRIAQTMNDITDELVRDARATLDLAQTPVHQAMDGAAAAKHLVEAMDRVQKQKTQTACSSLNALLPKQNITLVVHMAAVNPGLELTAHRTLTTNALAKVGAGKTKSLAVSSSLNSSLNRDWSVLKTKQEALSRPTLPPGAANSFKRYEDEMYRGLNKTQAQSKKNELIAEARRRFADDPKTLDKVLVYLNKTTDARVKLAPAAIR